MGIVCAIVDRRALVLAGAVVVLTTDVVGAFWWAGGREVGEVPTIEDVTIMRYLEEKLLTYRYSFGMKLCILRSWRRVYNA